MRSLLALLALCAVGCGAQKPLASRFEGQPQNFAAVLASAKAAPAPEPTPVVVGVADQPRSVFAFDLASQRLLFRTPALPVATPLAVGEFVVVPEAAHVTVRRLRDGSVVKDVASSGMHFVGAAGDGTLTAIVLSTGGTMNARSRLVVLRNESVALDQKLDRALGAPAVLGGVLFVPHNRVHVSAMSAEGVELARARVQHDVASFAFTRGQEVYFGQRAVTLLDERLGSDGSAPTTLKFPFKNKLPGTPAVLPDTSAPPPPPESAIQRVSLAFLPQPHAGELKLANNVLYATFYPLLFGLAPDASTARWAYQAESDIVALRALDTGLLAVEAGGRVLAFDPHGALLGEVALGLSPIAASIRADHLPRGASVTRTDPISEQLERIARSPDARLVPARAFAATLLGTIDDDDAARALIALSTDANTPERVREAAIEALGQRKTPSEAAVLALSELPDFVAAKPKPPLVALARAVARSKDLRAFPHLVKQLESPASTPEELIAILDALAALAEPSGGTPVGAFVRLYHADDGDAQEVLPKALETLVTLDGERALPLVQAVAADPLAVAPARAAAERLAARFATESPQQRGGETTASAPPEPAAEVGPPLHLTTRHVDEALATVRAELARCVRNAPERPASARLVLVIEGNGTVSDVRALPESVLACVAPLVRSATLPETKYGKRSVMSYVVPR